MANSTHVTIVGAGLSGLVLAYLLENKNISYSVLEASNRIGGRIQTINGVNHTPMELGATWFSDLHMELIKLLNELGLKKFVQYKDGKSLFYANSNEPPETFIVPSTESVSYRVKGGTQKIIDTLYQKINCENLKVNTKIVSIEEKESKLELLSVNGEKFQTDKVVLAFPPQLVGSSITFIPSLNDTLNSLLPTIQTWMAGSIKFVLEYKEAFWRKNGYSGMLFSRSIIIKEMYDHTNFEKNRHGFTGFLHPLSNKYQLNLRKHLVIKQVTDLFGQEAFNALQYSDKIWTDEFILGNNEIVSFPHQYNGHPLLQDSYMNGKLFFSATESSLHYPGYMEGAVRSAINIYDKLMS